MKRIIIICVTVVICAAIFAAPIYYDAFYKQESIPAPVVEATPSTTPQAVIYSNRYTQLAQDNNYFSALVLDQDTGDVYFVDLQNTRLITNIQR